MELNENKPAGNNIGFKAQLDQKKEVLNMAYVVPHLWDDNFRVTSPIVYFVGLSPPSFGLGFAWVPVRLRLWLVEYILQGSAWFYKVDFGVS